VDDVKTFFAAALTPTRNTAQRHAPKRTRSCQVLCEHKAGMKTGDLACKYEGSEATL